MKKLIRPLALGLMLMISAIGCGRGDGESARFLMRTSQGEILLELDYGKAPLTCANFERYAEEGFYDETIFHRVISTFMIQGGGFTEDICKKETHKPIKNEADNGLKNRRGTIAMARTSAVHSATSQFFINVENNDNLDHRAPNPPGFGYCVFGRVIEGMDTVDKIRAVPTEVRGNHKNVPRDAVVIESVRLVE